MKNVNIIWQYVFISWGPTEVQIYPNNYISLWFRMMLAMLLGCCTVSSCQSIAKQSLRCFWVIANWSISKETSIKSGGVFFFLQSFFFFFCGSLNSNKIQERWCLHACFDSFTHFRLVFHIVNYDIHYVVYSERVREVLHPLGQCWLQAVF